ncbi:hypothetical protein XALC_0637 [Xanthomonas albilineans GPE PC73]|uniref:Uncharacterized protein n=1 Tax=Xanthomonas albilineans (strain GPE PC73 / CFBP 7063) TaxID=380358 RepID=D2UBZ0_XANAP|nr:hypothetical protein XALC_0637 [Xanthomonas albilineans GPE PC73]
MIPSAAFHPAPRSTKRAPSLLDDAQLKGASPELLAHAAVACYQNSILGNIVSGTLVLDCNWIFATCVAVLDLTQPCPDVSQSMLLGSIRLCPGARERCVPCVAATVARSANAAPGGVECCAARRV